MRRLSPLVATTLVVLLMARIGYAGEPLAAATPENKPAPAASSKESGAPSGGELNFDLFNEPKQSPVEKAREQERLAKLERAAKMRRTLLQAHQAIGFITLGALAATLVIGQLNYQDKYGGGDDRGTYYNAHLGLAIATSATFATTGILALAAPNPYPKPIKFDAALVHKASMAAATAGMVAQLILGPITMYHEGRLDQRDLALAHLVTGYATFGFMTAGVLAYVF
jgi:hypothetical protein